MSRIRRGGYVFVTRLGDHAPRHVHVYRDQKLIVKWNLEDRRPMYGKASPRILELIAQLEAAGRL